MIGDIYWLGLVLVFAGPSVLMLAAAFSGLR